MKNLYRKALILMTAVLVCIGISGCGCGKKKEPEAEASQVIKITITPEAEPTLTPNEMNPEAVEKNGNLTMVNEYLNDDPGSADTMQESINQTDTDQAEDDSDENQE